ncbi:hypothetical protein [Bacillus cereus]|uniref:hypothetical protein n=1 Tax=Bacillus cereus TaxID=1396 RepID=UPI00033114BC|nr:hypothetical protein [Bacillus cereus]EOO19991.1 hypothetical protein IG9_01051 [Bacillus cereus HuA2-9]
MADIKSRELNASNSLQVNVELDASEAIKGLKAIQREAKVATKALRELEEAQKAVNN